MKTGLTRLAMSLRIFCAVLLLSLGFAHKPVYAQSSIDPASSYYVLPDGSFADLCIGDVEQGKPKKSWFASACDACRLAASVLLPGSPVEHAVVARLFHGVEFPARPDFRDTTTQRPGSPVRGPPSLLG